MSEPDRSYSYELMRAEFGISIDVEWCDLFAPVASSLNVFGRSYSALSRGWKTLMPERGVEGSITIWAG